MASRNSTVKKAALSSATLGPHGMNERVAQASLPEKPFSSGMIW